MRRREQDPASSPCSATTLTLPAATRVLDITALPFSSWGNRGAGAMRIWLPIDV